MKDKFIPTIYKHKINKLQIRGYSDCLITSLQEERVEPKSYVTYSYIIFDKLAKGGMDSQSFVDSILRKNPIRKFITLLKMPL